MSERIIETVDYYEAKAKVIYHTFQETPVKTLVIDLQRPYRILSTRDGFKETRYVLNHYNPPSMWEYVHANWRTFEQEICADLGLQREEVAMLSTGVDMDNLAVAVRLYEEFSVTVLATAGVKHNALRTGVDSGGSLERDGEFTTLGTINLIILTNASLTDSAMARAIITVTEAKSAVLQDLKIASTFTPDVIATGTGTDNLVIVKGTGVPIHYTGGHSIMGELIGKTVYNSVNEAIQNCVRNESD